MLFGGGLACEGAYEEMPLFWYGDCSRKSSFLMNERDGIKRRLFALKGRSGREQQDREEVKVSSTLGDFIVMGNRMWRWRSANRTATECGERCLGL